MAPATEHKGNKRHDRSGSPVRYRHSSPHRRKSPRRESSPAHRNSSPGRGSSRSPSPHSKRLRRDQAYREVKQLEDKEQRRSSGKEEHDRGRPRNREEVRDASHGRRSTGDKIDGNSSSYLKHERWSHRRRHSSSSPSRTSKPAARVEVGAKLLESENVQGYDDDSIAKMKAAEAALNEKEKQNPSFELSRKLAEETNKVQGVTLLFTEPADARKPDIRWRLYVFKSGEVLNEPLYVHRQSCYLFGRERRVADIPTDHPSFSKQHAVIQFRLVEKEQPDGLMSKQVRPYIMDLGSTNGTFINVYAG